MLKIISVFVEVQLQLWTLKSRYADLQLSEVTKNKTLKQTHPWILITALTSEGTVAPAHLRSGKTERKYLMSTRTIQTLQNNHCAEETKRVLL